MKKLWSIILSTVLLLGVACFPAVSADEVHTFDKQGEAEAFFRAFQLSNEEIDAEASVTRGEFAFMVKNAMKHASGLAGGPDGVTYEDVTEQTKYASEILSLASLGIMVGEQRGPGVYAFRPEDTITMTEAVKVMVDMLGYTDLAANRGGYPTGYLVAAQSMKLLSGLSAAMDKPAGPDTVKKLIYNTLNTEVASYGIEGGVVTLTKTDGETYLKKYWNLEMEEGLFYANSFLNATGEKPLGKNQILVGGKQYSSKLMEENYRYFGMYVKLYLDRDNANEVVCIIPASNKNEQAVINSADIMRRNGLTSFETEQEDGEKEVYTTAATADVFYNFEYLGPVRTLDFNSQSLKDKLAPLGEKVSMDVTLTDNDGDGEYDVIWIKSYQNVLVKDFTNDPFKITGEFGEKLEMNTAYEKNSVMFTAQDGTMFNPKNFERYDVLSVIAQKDSTGMALRAAGYVSKVSVSGAIREVSEDGYMIEETSYQPTAEYLALEEKGDKKAPELRVGLESTFYINRFGMIAGVNRNETTDTVTMNYGYLLKAARAQGVGGEPLVKMFTEGGEIKNMSLAERTKINGVNYRGDEVYKNLLTFDIQPGGDKNSFVIYRLTRYKEKDNKIFEIDIETAKKDAGKNGLYAEKTLQSSEELKDTVFKSSTIGKAVGLSNSTVIFNVPNVAYVDETTTVDIAMMESYFSDSKSMFISSVGDMVGDCIFGKSGVKSVANAPAMTMQFYELDSTKFAETVVLRYRYVSGGGDGAGEPETLADVIVVEKISQGVNEDGENVMVINGLSAGQPISVYTEPVIDALDPWGQIHGLKTYYLGTKASTTGTGDNGVNPKDVQPGDIIQVLKNSKGEVINIMTHLRAADADNCLWLMKSGNNGQGNEYLGVNFGRVLEYSDGKVILKELDGSERVYLVSNVNATKFNRGTKTVSKGSLDDIEPGMDLYIRQYYSGVKEVVYYE